MDLLWRGSLKTRVTLATLGIFLISIWSLALFSSQVVRDDLVVMVGKQQFGTVSLVADEINRGIELRLSELQIAST